MSAGLNTLQEACTGPEATLVPGRLRGFRWFNFTAESPLGLGSVAANSSGRVLPWQSEMTARCYNHARNNWYPSRTCQAPNPSEDHQCGIYGYHTPLHTTEIRNLNQMDACFGVIEAHGRILLGDIGFRAEHAKISAVSGLPDKRSVRTCEAAGIAVYGSVSDLVSDWPVQDISSLVKIRDLSNDAVILAENALGKADYGVISRAHKAEFDRRKKRARTHAEHTAIFLDEMDSHARMRKMLDDHIHRIYQLSFFQKGK